MFDKKLETVDKKESEKLPVTLAEAGITPANKQTLEQGKPGYQTQDEFTANLEQGTQKRVADQTLLITDLSHQLEEARTEIETLKTANREWAQNAMRAEAARDAMKELIGELWERRS